MLPFFSRLLSSHPARHLIAIDIGSNTAIRSVLFTERGEERIVIKKECFELPVRERETDLIPLISEYLRRLFFRYLRIMSSLPDETLIGLGNHFTFNECTTLERRRERPHEPIHPAEFRDMIEKFLGEHREKTIAQARYTLQHIMPLQSTVDGYPISSLAPRTRGQTLGVALVATYTLAAFGTILSELRSILGGIELRFVSNQAAIGTALVSLLKVTEALIIKIGTKVTEVSILSDGAIRSTGALRIGGDHFTRAIAERLGVTITQAEELKRQLATTILPPKTLQGTERAIAAALEQWLAAIVAFLKQEERFLLPERVYLLGGGARLRAIAQALGAKPWYGELTFRERLDIQCLGAEDFKALTFRSGTVPFVGPEEVALAALVNRLIRRGAHPVSAVE